MKVKMFQQASFVELENEIQNFLDANGVRRDDIINILFDINPAKQLSNMFCVIIFYEK